MSTSSVATAWYNVMGRLISMPTIYRRIRSWGLHSYRPHLVLPLTREHRRQRLNWCRERINGTARTVGVMVWGAICYGSRSPLIFIQGSMNARRYVQEVLQPVLVPYVQDIPNGLYQQDNARPHIARVSLEYLEHANVNLLPWPPRSPDLSPIEHVWDMIGQRLKNLARRPQTIQQFRHEIQVIWDALPQEEIDNLIRSMPRHVAECVNLQGGPTHY
jgi:hypothetical protein